MNLLYRRVSWLVLCLTVHPCRSTTIHGDEGQNVTLPCKYDSQSHGKCEICWMKGDIPFMGCGDKIIATDGDKVVDQTSSRYQLNGELQEGDVSLTIINAKRNDSGRYGCRVHVSGLFNDIKNYVDLIITAKLPAKKNMTRPVPSTHLAITTPWDNGTSYGKYCVNTTTHNQRSAAVTEKNIKETSHDTLLVTLLSVLLILLIFICATVLLLLKWKRGKQMVAGIRVQNVISSNSQMRGLEHTAVTEENVYNVQLDNEYEYV